MDYKERLKQYLEEDTIYTEYKSGKCDMSDFDKFCIEHCKDIECLLNENEEQKEVIDKAISQLGMYADILTNNCDAYSICVSLLDTLKRGGINGRRRFQEKI